MADAGKEMTSSLAGVATALVADEVDGGAGEGIGNLEAEDITEACSPKFASIALCRPTLSLGALYRGASSCHVCRHSRYECAAFRTNGTAYFVVRCQTKQELYFSQRPADSPEPMNSYSEMIPLSDMQKRQSLLSLPVDNQFIAISTNL